MLAWVKTLFVEQAADGALAHGVVEFMERGGQLALEPIEPHGLSVTISGPLAMDAGSVSASGT